MVSALPFGTCRDGTRTDMNARLERRIAALLRQHGIRDGERHREMRDVSPVLMAQPCRLCLLACRG